MSYNIKLKFLGVCSYVWYKNADSIVPVRIVKTLFYGLKSIFCGYTVCIIDPDVIHLHKSYSNAWFASEIDIAIGQRQVAVSIEQPSVYGINDKKTLLGNKVTMREEMVFVKPQNVSTLDEAKALLTQEYNKQKESIAQLYIEEKYDHVEKHWLSGHEILLTGSRRAEFQRDLDLQYAIVIEELNKCDLPKEINNNFHESVFQMQRLGIFRYWCLRQNAPDNPMPYYKGRVSFRNQTGISCGPHAATLLVLHTGTMNYFIFRPISSEEDIVPDNFTGQRASRIKHQNEWKRLYAEVLFGSTKGGMIDLPDWFESDFCLHVEGNQANAYNGVLFDKRIAFKPKIGLKRKETPNTNTTQLLKERILSDWRACRLHTGTWHYITLIRNKEGKIVSIDGGNLGRRTFKNSQELLNKFLIGEKPYEQPSYIDFWE